MYVNENCLDFFQNFVCSPNFVKKRWPDLNSSLARYRNILLGIGNATFDLAIKYASIPTLSSLCHPVPIINFNKST